MVPGQESCWVHAALLAGDYRNTNRKKITQLSLIIIKVTYS